MESVPGRARGRASQESRGCDQDQPQPMAQEERGHEPRLSSVQRVARAIAPMIALAIATSITGESLREEKRREEKRREVSRFSSGLYGDSVLIISITGL